MNWIDDPDMPLPLMAALKDSQSKYKDDLIEFFSEHKVGKNADIDAISVTTLSKSPRQVQLISRHKKEIKYKPIDFYFSLKGSIIHYILEYYAPKHWIKEERVKTVCRINGERVMIHGQPDAYDPVEKVLWDWKFTSGISIMYDKPEHTMQLNILNQIFKKNGIDVHELKNCYLIERLDARYMNDPGYPKKEYKVVDQPILSSEEVWAFVGDRAEIHLNEKDTPDKSLPLCTDEERWVRGTQFLVYKRKVGTKKQPIQDWSSKSVYKADSKEEAVKWIKNTPLNEEVKIVTKKGEPKACEYCEALPFCNQRQKELREQNPLGLH